MKTFSRIFPVLAFVLAAFFVAGAAPAEATEPSKKLQQLQDEVWRLQLAGSYQQALPLDKQALALAVAEFGPDSLQASIRCTSVGATAERVGDFAEAARQYAENLRIAEILSGRDSQIVAQALERLGRALFKLGRLTEAEAHFSREVQMDRDLYGEENVAAGAYSGLGAVNLARGDAGAALANYRKAVHRLTSRPAERVTDRSLMETQIKEHRDTFIGLGRAAAALRLKPGADERRLMEESFAAGQRAWGTSAASALAKMTARLKAGETELGRAVRHLDELNERILERHQQDIDEAVSPAKMQGLRQMMDAFGPMAMAQMKKSAPMLKRLQELAPERKRQDELAERVRDLAKRCPTAGGPGCAGSDRERTALLKELGEVSAKISRGLGKLESPRNEELGRQMMQSMEALKKQPGFAGEVRSAQGAPRRKRAA